MKKCSECGKKYDENLEKCPSCELSNYNKSNDGKKKMIIIIVIAVAVIGIIALLIDLNSNKSGGGNNGGSGNPGGSYVATKDDHDDNDYSEDDYKGLEDLEVTKDVTKEVVGTYNDEEIKAEITVTGVYWTSKLLPPNPRQSYYTYYDGSDDEIYQVIEMVVKNTGTESFSDYVFEGFLSDTCTPTFTFDGGYSYKGITLIEVEKDSSGRYDLGSFYSINPLVTKTIYAVKSVPEATKDLSLTVNLCFGDNKLNIHW